MTNVDLRTRVLRASGLPVHELRAYITDPQVQNYRACMPRGCMVIHDILDGKSVTEIARTHTLSEDAVWRSARAALEVLQGYLVYEQRAVKAKKVPPHRDDPRYMHYLNLLYKLVEFKEPSATDPAPKGRRGKVK